MIALIIKLWLKTFRKENVDQIQGLEDFINYIYIYSVYEYYINNNYLQ